MSFMQYSLIKMLKIPNFYTDEDNVKAYIITLIITFGSVITILGAIFTILTDTPSTPQNFLYVTSLLTFLIVYLLLRAEKLFLSSLLLVSLMYIIINTTALTRFGIYTTAIYIQVLLILVAGTLFSIRGVILITVLAIVGAGFQVLAIELETPPTAASEALMWSSATAIFIMTGTLVAFTAQVLREVLSRATQNEFRYRIVSELTSDFAFSYAVNPDGSIEREWNTSNSLKRLTGYSIQELGNGFSLYHPDDVSRAQADVQKVINGESVVGEYRTVTKSGEVRWFRTFRQPIFDDKTGRVIRFYGVTQHISQQKEQANALIASEKQLRAFAMALPDRAVVLDKEGNYQNVLKSLHDTTHPLYTDDEILLSLHLSQVYTPKFVTFCLEKIAQTINEGKALVFEYACPLRGDPYRFEGRTAPYPDPISNETHVIWVERDISERLQAEKQRVQLALEQERVTFLREFIGNMTHDLKTPVTVLKTSMYLLKKQEDELKRATYLSQVDTQINQLEKIIEDILTIAQLENIPKLDKAPTNIVTMMSSIKTQLMPKLIDKQHRLSLEISPNFPLIMADAEQINRVLLNLIENAIHYTPPENTIKINLYFDTNIAYFKIQDNGIGIPATDISHIFQRFFRSDNARQTTPGTGLGLAIVKRIVDLHNASIDIKSDVGQGTTFTLGFPLFEPTPDQPSSIGISP